MRKAIPVHELFLGFAQLGLTSFGSALAFARQILILDRKWLDEREFAEIYGLSQALPGPNVGNLAVIFGAREGGALGAIAAIAGFLLPPLIVVLAIATAIFSTAAIGSPYVQGALRGSAAVAAGLVTGTGLAMTRRILGDRIAISLAVLAFTGISIGLPLYVVVAIVLPLGIAANAYRSRRHSEGEIA